MRYITQLADLGRGDLAVAGGKGANLGELTRAGLPVPPGFVLTTAAYRAYVAAAASATRSSPARVRHGSGRTTASASAPVHRRRSRTRSRRSCAPPARSWGRPSRSARRPPPRTSTTRASPASRTPTSNVRGDDALLAAVRDCWASLWTARAMAYRARQGIDPAEVALAVVVQRDGRRRRGRGDVHREPDQRPPRRDGDLRRVGPRRGGGGRRGDHRRPRGREGGPARAVAHHGGQGRA